MKLPSIVRSRHLLITIMTVATVAVLMSGEGSAGIQGTGRSLAVSFGRITATGGLSRNIAALLEVQHRVGVCLREEAIAQPLSDDFRFQAASARAEEWSVYDPDRWAAEGCLAEQLSDVKDRRGRRSGCSRA